MGINAMPPCPPDSSPFSACRLMHLTLIREGVYSSFAQKQIVPAQYWREEGRLDDYYRVNTFLRDINNERAGDEGVVTPDDEPEPRNEVYKKNLESLNRLVLIRFRCAFPSLSLPVDKSDSQSYSEDTTVVPAHSSHFTLPSPNATNCPVPPLPSDPFCYSTPLPWSALPLYKHDYVGLRTLNEGGRVTKGVCEGAHMQIDEECWEGIVKYFGKSGEKGPAEVAGEDGGEEERGDEVWFRTKEEDEERFVIQL
jgi:palmitoyl-protein thioesterase